MMQNLQGFKSEVMAMRAAEQSMVRANKYTDDEIAALKALILPIVADAFYVSSASEVVDLSSIPASQFPYIHNSPYPDEWAPVSAVDDVTDGNFDAIAGGMMHYECDGIGIVFTLAPGATSWGNVIVNYAFLDYNPPAPTP